MNHRTSAALVVFLALFTATAAQSQTPGTAKEAPKTAPKRDEKSLDYEKFLKDAKKFEGNVTLWQKGKKLYMEVPENKLGKLFIIQAALNTGLNTGLLHSGMPVGDSPVDVFRFDRSEDVVSLVRPNIGARWEKDDPYHVGAQRTYPEAFLASYPIEQQDPEKKLLLVNVTALFSGDYARLGEMIGSGLAGPYQLDAARSGPDKIKGFPENTTVQMKLHYFSPRGAGEANPLLVLLGLAGGNTLEDDRSAPLRVTYNISWRKESNYVPRLADPRIGFFTTDFYNVAKFTNLDPSESYINRFNLVKKDPAAKLSEPVKPIVWTIDTSIPAKFKPAVRDGILRWNKAFEEIGFKNAIVVKEASESDPDYDHADGRTNVVRFTVGPSAPWAAISLFRTDPISGEILNASITVDGNVVSQLISERNTNLDAPAAKGNERMMQVFLNDPSRTIQDDAWLFATQREEAEQKLGSRLKQFGWRMQCDFASAKEVDAHLAWEAASLSGAKVTADQYTSAFLAECVSHEAGHCLGLRHNFAGSLNLSTAQLADTNLTDKEGLTASVMDYTPSNAQAILSGKTNYFSKVIGSYDEWAIRYGYSPIDAKTPIGEKFQLSQIARESGLAGHAFLTDEDADSVNPNAVRFDFGKDPLAYSAKQLRALRYTRNLAINNLPKNGESYSQRTKIILGTIQRSSREARVTARFIGGTRTSRVFRGDVGDGSPVAPVTAAEQRTASQLLLKEFLSPDSFQIPKSVLQSLSLTEDNGGWNAPVQTLVSNLQGNVLSLMLSGNLMARISENAYKAGPLAYTLDEHYNAVVNGVFAELKAGSPTVPLRRDLQKLALTGLITQAGAPTGLLNNDARNLANEQIRTIDGWAALRLAKPTGLDKLTVLHLRELRAQIARFQTRRVSVDR